MGPTPAVMASPPLAAVVLPNVSRQANIVWRDATIGARTFNPAVHIVLDPICIFFLARQKISIDEKCRSRQVGWHISPRQALFYCNAHLLCIFVILEIL